MISVQWIEKEKVLVSRWKNGLGYTSQIAIFPPNADLRKADFLFRLSSAHIQKNSPFSEFLDHDRTLVILSGEGIRLVHTFEPGVEDAHTVLPFEPFDFPGDVQSRCELIAGPVTDLGLMIKKGSVESQVQVIDLEAGSSESWTPEGRWNYFFVAEGSLRFDLESSDSKARASEKTGTPGDTLVVELEEACDQHPSYRLSGHHSQVTRLILISLNA